MTFISYARNFEDVFLWRALQHVRNGFYIDMGAQDSVICSVSLGFYEQGWRGVHVVASPLHARKLREARPDEEVLEIIGRLSPDDTDSLTAPFDRYVDRDVHWFRIDAEDMQKAVSRGGPLSSAVRPWIIVVENTVSVQQMPSYVLWEPDLLSLGYDLVGFDGLNRFYLRHDKADLKADFGQRPNLFDDFHLAPASRFVATAVAAEQAARVETAQQFATERKAHDHTEKQLAFEKAQRAALEQQVQAILNSTSWRITAPLRQVSRTGKWLKIGIVAWVTFRPGSRPHRVAGKFARYVLARPWLAERARLLLKVIPVSVRTRIRLIALESYAAIAVPQSPTGAREVSELSARAREIYALLLKAQSGEKTD